MSEKKTHVFEEEEEEATEIDSEDHETIKEEGQVLQVWKAWPQGRTWP